MDTQRTRLTAGCTTILIKTKTYNVIPESYVSGYVILRQVHETAPAELYAYALTASVDRVRYEHLVGRFATDLLEEACQAVERFTG